MGQARTDYTALQQRLFHSASGGDVLAGAQHLFAQTAWVRVTGAGALGTDSRVGGWIRGALGQMLLSGASPRAVAGQRCDWTWPCALDMLYGNQGHTRRHRPIAKPYVPLWQIDGDDLLCGVRLFGFACEKVELVLDAMIRGLRAPGTLKLHPRHLDENGIPMITDAWISDDLLPPVADDAAGAVLFQTITPMHLPNGAQWHNGRDLVRAVLTRLGPVLRWCDYDARDGFGKLLQQGEAMAVQPLEASAKRWVRKSHRQSGRSIGVDAHMLTLVLSGVSPELHQALACASLTLAGTRCTLGLGRYQISSLDGN